MTPMPNHLSTLKLHHNRVENTLNPTKKPHKKWWGSEKESGSEKEMGEKKGSGEVER